MNGTGAEIIVAGEAPGDGSIEGVFGGGAPGFKGVKGVLVGQREGLKHRTTNLLV